MLHLPEHSTGIRKENIHVYIDIYILMNIPNIFLHHLHIFVTLHSTLEKQKYVGPSDNDRLENFLFCISNLFDILSNGQTQPLKDSVQVQQHSSRIENIIFFNCKQNCGVFFTDIGIIFFFSGIHYGPIGVEQ